MVEESMGELHDGRQSGSAESSVMASANRVVAGSCKEQDCTLEIKGVTKAFGSTVALSNVTLTFNTGTVHGLVGENGSGKSTLVKLIAGLDTPDVGTISSPILEASVSRKRLKVGSVFQDGTLIDELTVEENVRLIASRAGGGAEQVQRIFEEINALGIVPASRGPVADLSNSVRRMIEIVAVVALDTDVVLFDEATSVLDEHQVELFNEIVREVARRGTSVVIVSHRLREVLVTCESIAVLRDGVLVWQGASDQVDEPKLVDAMAGREVAAFVKEVDRGASKSGNDVLLAHGVSLGTSTFDVVLYPGEIMGIGGPAGHGQSELLRLLGGERHHNTSGTLSIAGQIVNNVTDANSAGAVFVSSDRQKESLFQGLSIRENYGLSFASGVMRKWWIARGIEEARARAYAREHGLVYRSIEQPAVSLSGGNQQKLAIGRALVRNPAVLLVEAPTEGVDVRSRIEIYRRLQEAAQNGIGIIFTSTDASELASLADKVLVVADRCVVAELSGDGLSETNIVSAFAIAMEDGVDRASGLPRIGSLGRATFESMLDRIREVIQASRRAQRSESATVAFLVMFLILIWVVGSLQHSTFLSSHNFDGVSLVAVPIIFGAFAEFMVIMVGEIDISIAGMMGLVLVGLSFFPTQSWPILLVLALAMGIAMGTLNGIIVIGSGANAVIITIAMLSVYEGVGLYLRPSPAGNIASGVVSISDATIGNIVIWAIVAVGIAMVADLMIRRSRWGLKLRAIGFDRDRAMRLGVPGSRVRLGAFALSGVFAGLAGFLLAGQTGTGDATVGSSYLLIAIAVPVIGGASLLGGRGTMVGCVVAGVILASIESLVSFANLPSGYYEVAVGLLTLVALGISLARRRTVGRERPPEIEVTPAGEA